MYTLLKQEGAARRGRFETPHGTIETPVFMNVGTCAAIKGGISTMDLIDVKCQVELSNTYHLHLRPGDRLIHDMGGLRKFFNWDKPVLTDSGGFQVFSLAQLRKITEEGVNFASHIDGYAIGGLAVGESAEEMYETIDVVEPHMPKDKPRYLMGVGTPCNILESVHRGVDFFDCVMPSRNARHGNIFTWHGKMNLLNEKYIRDPRPIDENCGCPACQHYSRSYIRHLFKAKEMLGMRLAVLHNLYFYNDLMQKIRDALDEGKYEEFYRHYREILGARSES